MGWHRARRCETSPPGAVVWLQSGCSLAVQGVTTDVGGGGGGENRRTKERGTHKKKNAATARVENEGERNGGEEDGWRGRLRDGETRLICLRVRAAAKLQDFLDQPSVEVNFSPHSSPPLSLRLRRRQMD